MLWLQIDVTDQTPEQVELMTEFNLFGPPSMLFFTTEGEQDTLRILGEMHKAEFVQHLNRYKYRGSSGKVNLALDRLPEFKCRPGDGKHIRGDIAIAPNIDYLEKTGLTIVKEEKRFDRFKGRVMFPIHSMSGRVLGFGGRILITDKKINVPTNSTKYLIIIL